MGPALAETDPRFGPEAALSEFDAVLAAGAFFEKNDRAFNNAIAGLGTQFFQQDAHVYNLELRKRTAVGTSLAVRKRVDYDFNNSPFNNNPNLPWTMRIEGEIRQPLLQGAGVDFNRIVGPGNVPGFYNGVLITRINTDLSLADFEAAVTQLVADVENAYWELFFAYRDLDAKLAARQRAYESWRQLEVLPGEGVNRAVPGSGPGAALPTRSGSAGRAGRPAAGEDEHQRLPRHGRRVCIRAASAAGRAVCLPPTGNCSARPTSPRWPATSFSWDEALDRVARAARRAAASRSGWSNAASWS